MIKLFGAVIIINAVPDFYDSNNPGDIWKYLLKKDESGYHETTIEKDQRL